MSKLKFIDYPENIDKLAYDNLKQKIVSNLKSFSQVKSIYQMGSVKEPGISDLDIICVFEENSNCNINIRNELSAEEKKILTHSLFGVEKNYFEQARNYNLISNLNLLHGDNIQTDSTFSPTNDKIQRQIALEYMLRMYLSLSEQVYYGVVKLRSFLLLGKAIAFDLELLKINSGKLYDLVNKILNYRSTWFTKTPSPEMLENLIISFLNELEFLLKNEFHKNYFYLPIDPITFPEGYSIHQSDKFKYVREGFILPSMFSVLGKKYINLQRRFNTVKYFIPFEIPLVESEIDNRFVFGRKLYEINNERYLHFMPLNSSLSIF
jgi:hypothetical protein